MGRFVGFLNLNNEISNKENILSKMSSALLRNKIKEENFYIDKKIAVSNHELLLLEDIQSKVNTLAFRNFIIVFDGQIYNTKELKETLEKNHIVITKNSTVEILLKSYIYYGKKVVNHLNGAFAFAIWDIEKEELFICRDHFGIKPFYYTIFKDTFIFSSEIKGILAFPGVERVLDSQGICELLGIGPAHTPGLTVFKNIYEIKPAYYGIFNKSGLYFENYWKLKSFEHTDSLGKTCEHLKFLLNSSIINQVKSDKSVCTFLSGGLDSSIITKFASDFYQKENLAPLKTYSIDYVDNAKNFVKNDFQPNLDSYYIDLMSKHLQIDHHKIIIDTPELINSLEDSLIARDMPGMADIDSSLLLFCKYVSKENSIALTGECADEIFGGYPWFFNKDSLNCNTFPWSFSISERQKLLNPSFSTVINLKDYIDFRYKESLDNVEILDSDSTETTQKKKISYLTLNWFMQTLLDRSDRMSMYNGLEIRVPFCNYNLVQYVWNIPWEWKALKGREKGLLRYLSKDFLPSIIVDRKKSPYPKTHNPNYLSEIKQVLNNIIINNNSPIHDLLDTTFISELLKSDGKSITVPWFGQLMTGPQLMAYICQINMWLEKYKIKIKL